MEHLPGQGFSRHFDQRDLGRIAEQSDHAALARLLDLLAVHGSEQQAPPEVARLGERFVGRIEEPSVHVEPADRHSVLGQGPGLVGADHRGRAQRLDRGEVLDQDVLSRQALARHGKRQGYGREQPLGHVGHDDADREHSVVPERQSEGVADREKRDPERGRQRRDYSGQECHLALERRQCRSGSLRKVRDFPECGAHACSEDHGAPIAHNQGRAGKQDIGAGCDLVLFARPGIPGDRKRFAGDRRAIDLHPERLDQAAISWNAVALADPDDVSGHEVARRQLDQSAGAFHGDHLRQQVAERGERPFAPRLLPEREQAVDQDDADDREREHTHPLARLVDLGE